MEKIRPEAQNEIDTDLLACKQFYETAFADFCRLWRKSVKFHNKCSDKLIQNNNGLRATRQCVWNSQSKICKQTGVS